ncbi:PPOX class F420-dependent oxidoreductase [Fodinicola feengrottensis]|uniref:PPOX class F420-dependent oxidoreductase n=1 Tax=Fodinicola feengrottensis TaxID=435914 RepID=A0ABN2GCG0_9ACTN
MTAVLDEVARELVDGRNVATLATVNPDGQPQLSIVFVKREDDVVIFSTLAGRQKTRNMLRDPRVTVLIVNPAGGYVEIRGAVEIVDDPEKLLPKEMYAKYMGGVEPPPEPEVERVIVRVKPAKVVRFSP